MKRIRLCSVIIAMFFFNSIGYAQLDNIEQSPRIILSEKNPSVYLRKEPISLSHKNSIISLPSIDKNDKQFRADTKPWSMSLDQGFYEPQYEFTPKAFKDEKEIKESYKSDQYLGDFKSDGVFVNLVYKDHQSVDGDKVRIYLNDDVIRSVVYLEGVFKGFNIDLVKGFNKIDIEALNQGASGPNTAAFKLYDDLGNLITSNEWNLTTGVKATMIIVKP